MPAYNHTRDDSPLNPCPTCQAEQNREASDSLMLRSLSDDPEREEINRIAWLLINTWERVEKRRVNVSYYATFADMARAMLEDRKVNK